MDLILGGFAQSGLARLGPDALDLYERLLAENDHDLYAWVLGQAAAPARYRDLIARITACHSNSRI